METLQLKELNSYGRKGKRGNILGIEPYLRPEDYLSASNLQRKLRGYLAAAAEEGWINSRTLVVWPEYIGTFLFASGEKPANTIQGLLQNLAEAHRNAFNAYFATATEQQKEYAAALRTKARDMAAAYQSVFSKLSREFAVTTVAGSIALPAPQIVRGKLVVDVTGLVYNVSMVCDRDGRLYPDLVFKAFPTAGELPYTTWAPAGSLPAYETPAGRVGIMICADSWYPQAYVRMKALRVELIAVPSFGHGGLKAWTDKWKGYDGWPNPPDVRLQDINRITNSRAWHKYSLIGRIDESGAARGINVFLHGDLWPDLDAGGGVAAVVDRDDQWKRENKTTYATLNNLWL